ncbi:MAG: YgjV family protein [Clostridia bacterium]|nr:YgjV family protein [Clostridia bacterium]
MNWLVIGNVVSFIGCMLMVAGGFIKEKQKVIWVQCVQWTLQGAAHLMLGAVGGCLACFISIVRGLVFTKLEKPSVLWKIGFLALQATLTVLFSPEILTEPFGVKTLILGVPFFSMVAYTWFLDTKSDVVFKIVNLVGVVMWVFYDLTFLNYSAFAFDIFTIITTVIGMVLILAGKRKKQ